MKLRLELYKTDAKKDGSMPLIIRFAINRSTYRYRTGLSFTESEWAWETNHGHKNSYKAIELKKKASDLLDAMDPSSFDMKTFKAVMEGGNLRHDPITKLWDTYEEKRKKQVLAVRTRELDTCMIKKLKEFLEENQDLDTIHGWDHEKLNQFYKFMIDAPVSVTTAGIYMRILSAFFKWLVEEKELLPRHPFRKYEIPMYENNWFPYSDKELAKILSVSPKTSSQEQSLKWVKMIIYSGGTDMKDFAEMTWRQVQSEAIQMRRTKTKKSSASSNKLLYLSDAVREVFDDLKTTKGKPDDYVFDIYKKGKTENQNLEFLKARMNLINNCMHDMLEKSDIHFTIKRLRPTAATIANNTTKNLNFVKTMLMHSNIKQTDTYLKRTPDDAIKKDQLSYEDALAGVQRKKGK